MPDEAIIGYYTGDDHDVWIIRMRITGYDSDDILTATMVMADGSTEEVRFHTGSEECLYIGITYNW